MGRRTRPNEKRLRIYRCPHGFWALILDNPDGKGGLRVTDGKCCGRWDRVYDGWPISAVDVNELTEAAMEAGHE